MKYINSSKFFARCLVLLLVGQICLASGAFAQAQVSQADAGVPLGITGVGTKPAADGSVQESAVVKNGSEQKNQFVCLPHEYSLSNGLKIILLQDKAYPLVSCFAWYNVGSRDDPAGMTGLSHLVEHLLFQNFGTFAKNQWANAIVRVGGEFSGFTSEDFTAFYSNLPSYQLELAIKGEAERMRGARFTRSEVNAEIDQLAKEAQIEEQDMGLRLNREVHALAYEKHPYRNPPGGWQHELERLTYEDAKTHYDHFFHPNNAVLVIAGGFDEPFALRLIEKYFGSIAKSDHLSPAASAVERPQLAERQIRLKARNGKEFVELAFKVSGIRDADAPIVSVIEQILSGTLSSKLVDTGLCSNVQVAYEEKRDPGLLVIKCAGIAPNGSSKVIQVIDTQLGQLKASQSSENEVKQAAQQAEFAYYRDGDGPYSSAFQLGFFATLAQGEMAYAWPSKVRQVNAADILRVARLYLNEENRVLGEIAVVAPAVPGEGKKVGIKIPSSDNNALNKTLSDQHIRLAAYQNGALVSYVVPGTSSPDGASNKVSIAPSAQPTGTSAAQLNSVSQSSKAVKDNLTVGAESKLEQTHINHRVLHNGLNVFVLESHLKPIVRIIGTVKAGFIYEKPNFRGMSKLLAALLNAEDSVSEKQISIKNADGSGLSQHGLLQFESQAENIVFSANCLSKRFSDQMQLIFNDLRDPHLTSTNLDLAKCDVALFLRRNEKKPQVKIERALLRGLVASNCAYYPIHPEEEVTSIANFRLDDLKDFYNQNVNPASTTLVICGDVKADDVFALCEQFSGGWSLESKTNTALLASSNSRTIANKNILPPKLLVSNRESYKSSLILPQLNPAEMVLGRIIPVSNIKQTENYWAAMLIADCALSSHPIISRVGEQFEINPELSASSPEQIWDTKIFKLADKLIWSMQIHLKPRVSSTAAVTAIQGALSEFSKLGLRQEEIVEAKRYLTGHIPVKDCSNLDGLAEFIFRGVNELNEVEPMSRVQRIINSLKYEDINEFIAKVFKPQLASIVVAGPRDLIKQVRPAPPEPVEANVD